MMAILSSLIAGLLFGAGIAISGMINPAKVLNFFDLFGRWDPSLAFVMAGALTVTTIGYQLIFRTMERPISAPAFSLPSTSLIDRRLVAGAAIFGAGWGIAGFCPGGALPALGLEPAKTAVFLIAVLIGSLLAGSMQKMKARGSDDA